jgi:hypothetical protein
MTAHKGKETLGIGQSREMKVTGNRTQQQLSVTKTHLPETYKMVGLPVYGTVHFPTRNDPDVFKIDYHRSGDDVTVTTQISLDVSSMSAVELYDEFGLEDMTDEEIRDLGLMNLIAHDELTVQQEWNAFHDQNVVVDGVEFTKTADLAYAIVHDHASEKIVDYVQSTYGKEEKMELHQRIHQLVEESDDIERTDVDF